MTRPRLLDLFCGGGGAGEGYHRAGFDVTGVDIDVQPHYPHAFLHADAMDFPLDGFDAVHASPPCQDHTRLRSLTGIRGTGWLLPATIERLAACGLPFVIEMVDVSMLPGSLLLCGTEFGLGAGGRVLKRHRRFVSNVALRRKGVCRCRRQPTGGIYGNGGGGAMNRGYRFFADEAREAMGIDWLPIKDLCQSIPPAYTEWIGGQLMQAVQERAQGREWVARRPEIFAQLATLTRAADL